MYSKVLNIVVKSSFSKYLETINFVNLWNIKFYFWLAYFLKSPFFLRILSDSSYFAVILMTIIQNKYYFPSVALEFSVRMLISYNFDQNQRFIYFQISKAFLAFCINFFVNPSWQEFWMLTLMLQVLASCFFLLYFR